MIVASPSGSPLFFGPKECINRRLSRRRNFRVLIASEFPAFIPKEVENINDPLPESWLPGLRDCLWMGKTYNQPTRIELTGSYSLFMQGDLVFTNYLTFLFPLRWLENHPSCDATSKRDHLYQLWSSYIKRPMTLVGPSLGAAVAIDFVAKYPEAVDKLILIDASVYAEGTGDLATLPKIMAYAGSIPLRLYATSLSLNGVSLRTCWDWVKVKQRTLVIWGEDDQIIDNKLAVRLHCELPNAILQQLPDCGHIPHVEKPDVVSKLITEFVRA